MKTIDVNTKHVFFYGSLLGRPFLVEGLSDRDLRRPVVLNAGPLLTAAIPFLDADG